MRSFPKCLIIGAGAVGQGLRALLPRSSVVLWGRGGSVEASGPVFCGEARFPDAVSVPFDPLKSEVDFVFFCVKAYDLHSALVSHLPRVQGNPKLICLANGAVWGEFLLQIRKHRLPVEDSRLGRVTFGARWESSAGSKRLILSEAGNAAWGMAPEHKGLAPTPNETLLFEHCCRLVWLEDAMRAVRKKWLMNTVINTVAAAHQLRRNGLLLENRAEVRAVLQEAWELGLKLHGTWPDKQAPMLDELWQLIEATANNENSMVRDLRLGRPTESPFLAGLAQNDDSFPLLRKLHNQIESLNLPRAKG